MQTNLYRCRACNERITADQLRIRSGWVRRKTLGLTGG